MNNFLKNSILDIIKKYSNFFLYKKNVIGIGLGNKMINSIHTNEPCLGVFVEKKFSANNLKKEDLVPQKFLGINTDLIELEIPNSKNITNDNDIKLLNSYTEKLQPGFSIGTLNYSGTIGAIVFDNYNNQPYILSNCHVLAENTSSILGEQIVQPAGNSSHLVAYLYKKVVVKLDENSSINVVDCALAKILSKIPYTTEIYKIGKIKGIKEAEPNIKVKKMGASTGYTTSTIRYTNSELFTNFYGKKILFKEIILCDPMDDYGDSGSLVLDNDNNAIGLLFAGSKKFTVLNPIDLVLKHLDVHF